MTAARTAAPMAVKVGAIAIVLGCLGAFFGALEAFVRWRSSQRWGFVDARAIKVFDPAVGGMRMVPNMRSPRLDTNALGYRGPLPELPKPPGRVRLAFLGASTTFCHESSSEAHTWPAQVHAAIAKAHPDRSFDYINAAISGWSMPVIRRAFEKDVVPLRPDIVFVYEATNALSLDTRTLAQEQGLLDEAPDEPSWLGERSVLVGLVEKNLKVWLRGSKARSGDATLQFDADVVSAAYGAEMRALVDRIREEGATPVLVTFAPRVRRGQSPEVQAEAMITTAYYMPYLGTDGALRGFEAYNARLREVASQSGAVLVDDIDAIPADAVHYTDSVHFTDAGAARMAERVARATLASPLISAVLTATVAR